VSTEKVTVSLKREVLSSQMELVQLVTLNSRARGERPMLIICVPALSRMYAAGGHGRLLAAMRNNTNGVLTGIACKWATLSTAIARLRQRNDYGLPCGK